MLDKYYHYVEIGTSNFGTLLGHQPPEQRGLSVEPMPFFVRELRDRYASSHPNAQLVNVALLPEAFEKHVVSAYYVHPDNITQWKLRPELRGMSRMGAPHPSASKYLGDRNLMHLLDTRPVRAMSFQRFLELYGVCRIGFLKLDVEGFDEELLKDYIQHLHKHPQCWTDALEFEVHPAFMNQQGVEKLLSSLASVGYYPDAKQVQEALAVAGSNTNMELRLVYLRSQDQRLRRFDLGDFTSHRWIDTAPAVPKIVHMLLPCFFTPQRFVCTEGAAAQAQRQRWLAALPDSWRLEIWSPQTLTAALLSDNWPKWLGEVKYGRITWQMPHYLAKYDLLSYFGGIFVDWQLHPDSVPKLLAAQRLADTTGLWCMDPGPSGLRSSSGSLIAASAFHPAVKLMALQLETQVTGRQDAQISLSEVELLLLKRFYHQQSGEDLSCLRSNFTRLRGVLGGM